MNTFFKYQGAGNDFILIDNRDAQFNSSMEYIRFLCDRRFGIGADGLMLLEADEHADFNMRFFNSDGKEGTMCGNGGRCIVAFARQLGIIGNVTRFNSPDGIHEATINAIQDTATTVNLKIHDVNGVTAGDGYYFLNTGSPHYVRFIDKVEGFNVTAEGEKVRHSKLFAPNGTNVNFVEIQKDKLLIATFERGVEAETLACGTGATAAAIATSIHQPSDKKSYNITAKGGELKVSFEKVGEGKYHNIWLEGPATFVFKGELPKPTA